MNKQEFRRLCFDMVNLPPDYDGDVLLPSHLNRSADRRNDTEFLARVGVMAVHYLNNRRKKNQ